MARSQFPDHPQDRLGRLGAWCFDHRRQVVLAWVAAVVVIIGVWASVGSQFEDNFGGQGQSQQAQAILHQRFPGQAGDSAQVVVHSTLPLATPVVAAEVDRLLAAVRPLPAVTSVSTFVPSPGGHIGFATVQFDAPTVKLPKSDVQRVIDVARSFAKPGFAVALGGPPISAVVSPAPGPSESIGIMAAVVIMLLAFGSVVAMALPIVTAVVGVGIGFAVVGLVSWALTVPTFGPELMAMIGLGVGIDYALFIVTRYRQGLAEGREPREAVASSHSSAGRAVSFAGATVVISLLGLLLVGQAYVVGLSVGTILAVLLVLAATLTLLPAMLGFAGPAIDRFHVPGLLHSAGPRPQQGFWWGWSRTVQRRPLLCGVCALLVLVVLAIPLFSMRVAFTDAGNDPPRLTTRQAYELLSAGFGPGFNGPLVVVADFPPRGDVRGRAILAQLDQRLRSVVGVARTGPPVFNRAKDAAVLVVYPSTGPQDAATASLVRQIRSSVIPAATKGTGVSVLVGGETAAGIDAAAALSARLPWVIGLVILVSMLLLMTVFRSVAIPIKAAAMNLLSIGAAYGVIVAVYQWGWLSSVFGVSRPGPIDPWIPLVMFTITFGLSMDYEVFLLSRVREEWHRTGDSSLAVADGLAATGRVITAAAAIMVCLFGSFVIGDPLHILDVFGLGLATAILVDATLVRMVLVPSVMQVLGRANWWLPRWADRHLPTLMVD
jgi:putative drug exporter of the RND superfamily